MKYKKKKIQSKRRQEKMKMETIKQVEQIENK